MTVLEEGALQLTLPNGVDGRKFDDETHGLSHCMKAVDFIVETPDRVLFVEFKDPDQRHAKQKDKDKFVQELLSGKKDDDFVYKYRDSFLYQWASRNLEKPVYYLVLVALSTLTEAELLARTDELKRKLPLEGPESAAWQRQIVAGCGVFNIETWNRILSAYPVSRVVPVSHRDSGSRIPGV